MKLPKFILLVFVILFSLYLFLPAPSFPNPPSDSLQSNEPGDIESRLRRSYFTNFSREEVIRQYVDEFSKSRILSLPLPSYKLNYPPEEAQTKIRDQARSTFLEEIVHPFRESIFVNGFEPKDPKDAIFIAERPWRQKITVRYYPSSVISRIVAMILIVIGTWYLLKEYSRVFLDIKKFIKR